MWISILISTTIMQIRILVSMTVLRIALANNLLRMGTQECKLFSFLKINLLEKMESGFQNENYFIRTQFCVKLAVQLLISFLAKCVSHLLFTSLVCLLWQVSTDCLVTCFILLAGNDTDVFTLTAWSPKLAVSYLTINFCDLSNYLSTGNRDTSCQGAFVKG